LGITTLIVLTSAIPGNKFSLTMMQKVNPLVTMRICILLWALLGCVFALFVNRPGQEVRLYLISIFWGVLMGLKDPVDKTILCELIPKGVEAEMSGLYICSSQLFMWVSEEQIFINGFIVKN
jgi:MFS-type transporter involved in bile tolerance (Atg22 family)